ncbi:MAG TPA: ABC transporter ATP-binding protein [Pseudolysinimonas sp.]|jgi:iron(III) transport system ATP-binding protein
MQAEAKTSETVSSPVSHDAAPLLRVEGLHKAYRRADGTRVTAVDGVSFDLFPGEFMVLLGPSGCGKTTLLRSIAGLEDPDSGRIIVQERTVYSGDESINIAPEKRHLSMVFQSYALWPHLSVFENIAYPLRSLPRSSRPSKAEITERVEKIMQTVGIAGLERQYPNSISGGQQQRVALCRALVAGSDIVLFDEPLSNIDAQVREQLRFELLTMQRELKFAALFVTHDRQEAMSLGTSIAVLDKGKIAQLGTPDQIYNAPTNRYVASFVGPTNEMDVDLRKPAASGMALGESPDGSISGVLEADVDGSRGVIAIWRPESGKVSTERPKSSNSWAGSVEHTVFYGSHTEHVVRLTGRRVRVLTTGRSSIDVGDDVWVSVDEHDVTFIPRG